MLNEPQAKYIEEVFSKLAESLGEEQLRSLCLRLDDLLLYNHNSLNIAYNAINEAWRDRRRESLEHTAYQVTKED